ncbi:transcriptional regulator TACO1-like protein [Lipomyces japonicus]|uniref:transcriptional regulator TACO1-like protein n=1 Tax=Lipomyces japonicus TaxID=56871 RepID=UPI0034CDDF9D
MSLGLFNCINQTVTKCHGRRTFSFTSAMLSGHNKWSTIKHDKAINDTKRNVIATKHSRTIIANAKIGGPDPNSNSGLYNAIESAKRASVPKRVIENALRRASGISVSGDKKLEPVLYEIIGPAGVAILVEALTDNKSRTAGEIRRVMGKNGMALGSTLFCFDRMGVVRVSRKQGSQDLITLETVLDDAIEAGADDVNEILAKNESGHDDDAVAAVAAADDNHVDTYEEPTNNVYELLIEDPSRTVEVADAMKTKFGYEIAGAAIEYFPRSDTAVKVAEEQGKLLQKGLTQIDELDDIQNVYNNAI